MNNPHLLHEIKSSKGGYITKFSWSPNGKWLAIPRSSHLLIDLEKVKQKIHVERLLEIWDPNGQELRTTMFEGLGWIANADWSPDSKQVFICMHSKKLFIGNPNTGQTTTEINNIPGLISNNLFVGKWSPKSDLIAVCSNNGEITFWDVNTHTLVTTFRRSKASISSIEFSPDGKYLASGTGDGKVLIWEMSSGDIIFDIDNHSSWVQALKWSRNGDWLISGSLGGKTTIYDTEKWETVHQLENHAKWGVLDVDFSANNKYLATREDGEVSVWETNNWEKICGIKEELSFMHTHGTRPGISFHPSDDQIFATLSDEEKSLRIWNLQ